MNSIEVSHVSSINTTSPLTEISAQLNSRERHVIGNAPWPEFPYKPRVAFALAYNDCLFVKFYVTEKSVRVLYKNANEPVYKDSCVEFFIAFDGQAEYYNMEFNCIGTCLLGYGSGRSGRKLLPEKLINRIRYHARIESSNELADEGINWELTLMIPYEVFAYHKTGTLKNTMCRANFFKCGDDLSEPHYLAWNNIITHSPDFHLPQFFGNIHFT